MTKLLLISLIALPLMAGNPTIAGHYFPEGADAEAIRAALQAETKEERGAHLEKVSGKCVAAKALVEILQREGLIDPGVANAVNNRIRQEWTREVKDRRTGKTVNRPVYPRYLPEDNFDTHPRVGVYQGENMTAQVVALPADGFFVNRVAGMFWEGTPEMIAIGVFADENRGSGKLQDWSVALVEDELTVTGPDGNQTVLTRVNFRNPALGTEPPAGATVLIDRLGKPVGLDTQWKTVDDALEVTVGNSSSRDEASGRIRMHLEFRTPNNPGTYNQARGNSGTFFGPYEIQINDNFGFLHEKNQCGGLYFFTAPQRNASLPPGTWQAYDAVFTPDEWSEDGENLIRDATITVHLNGQLIHDEFVLKYPDEKRQAAKKPMPRYPLSLQNHGNRVQFRNYWWIRE